MTRATIRLILEYPAGPSYERYFTLSEEAVAILGPRKFIDALNDRLRPQDNKNGLAYELLNDAVRPDENNRPQEGDAP